MNPNRSTLRLIILAQVFCLFFLMLMPTLIRLLNVFWGKALYTLLVVCSIGFALGLRRHLDTLE